MANVKTPTRKIRSAYGPKGRVSISFPEQGRTKQNHEAECNINNIMSRFAVSGVIDFVNTQSPQFGDATGLEFQTAMETVARANELFDAMPSKVRARFSNNPQELLTFLENPDNRSEAVFLGLLEAPEAPETPQVPETEPAAPVASEGA